MRVVLFPEAEAELDALPPGERLAVTAALEKPEVYGDRPSFPHGRAVKDASATLRELRPRAGRGPWRTS